MRARFEKISPPPDRSFSITELRQARFDAPWHFHPEMELTLIVESRGRRFVGDSIEPFHAGDLVLLGPDLPHFWQNEGTPRGRVHAQAVVVQFTADFLGPAFFDRPELSEVRRLLGRARRGLVFSGRSARAVGQRLRELPGRTGLDALLELLALLERLARARARPLASAAYLPRLDQRAQERLGKAYAFLTSHFREPLSLARIAGAAAMTPAAFSRFFRRVAGRNVSVFLNELRLDHAARLLRETPHAVTEIAHEAGFATLSSFNRRFRERFACAPRDYRRTFAECERPPTRSRFQSASAGGVGNRP